MSPWYMGTLRYTLSNKVDTWLPWSPSYFQSIATLHNPVNWINPNSSRYFKRLILQNFNTAPSWDIGPIDWVIQNKTPCCGCVSNCIWYFKDDTVQACHIKKMNSYIFIMSDAIWHVVGALWLIFGKEIVVHGDKHIPGDACSIFIKNAICFM